ncbi:MAG: NAD(P)/FAD-dependent oxidoreductase [Chitinophagaceae bacterium]
MELQDVIIIGGGPAGLNAAVVLGRCRRKVLLFDTGQQRNRRSHGMHNYLTRDDILPGDFIALAHGEIKKYGVPVKKQAVQSVARKDDGIFEVKDNTDTVYLAKKILVATGLADTLPELEGIRELYGHSVFHCPYCDGWEVRDQRLGIYARNKNGFELALSLTTWSRSVTYFTDGRNKLKPEQLRVLQQYGIPVINTRIRKLEGEDRQLKNILLRNEERIACDALFFVNGYTQQCGLVKDLGCTMSKKNVVITNRLQQTNVPGVYVAGDAARDMHFVVVAAAEGAKAAVVINKELQKEEKLQITTQNKVSQQA